MENWITIIIILSIIYFLPTLIAYQRWSINSWLVLFLNIILGWTIIVWFLLFFLATWKTKKDIQREEDMITLLKSNNDKTTRS